MINVIYQKTKKFCFKNIQTAFFALSFISPILAVELCELSPDVCKIQISTEIREEFEEFAALTSIDPYENPQISMQMMGEKLRTILPQQIIETLLSMGESGDPSLIVLTGLPIDRIILRDYDIKERVRVKGKISEHLILGIADVMNCEAKANPKEQNGSIIHNVAPVKGFEATRSSKGIDPFYLHTENPFEQSPPDFLILYCLEGDTNAKTTYFPVQNFIETLPKWVQKAMQKPEFYICSGKGLDQIEEGVFSLITCEGRGGKLRLRLYQDMERIRATTEGAVMALDYIALAAQHMTPQKISLNPGEMVIINNGWGIDRISGVMHGRDGYIENIYRWLQRAFLVRKIDK